MKYYIYVVFNGNRTRYTVPLSYHVRDLKSFLLRQNPNTDASYSLFFQGNELEESKTLQELKIPSESEIHFESKKPKVDKFVIKVYQDDEQMVLSFDSPIQPSALIQEIAGEEFIDSMFITKKGSPIVMKGTISTSMDVNR